MDDHAREAELKTFIGIKDYRTFAGPDWPTYVQILDGHIGTTPDIQAEVKNFVRMMRETYQSLTRHGESLAISNQHRQQQIFFDKRYHGKTCSVPWNTMGINANGDVFICLSPSWIPKFVGNIQECSTIYEVLNSDLALSIRQEILQGRYTYCNNRLCSFFSQIPPDQYQSYSTETQPAALEKNSALYVNQIPSDIILDFDVTCNFRCPSCRTELINNNQHHVIRAVNNNIAQCIKHLIIDQINDQPVQIRWCGGEIFISDVYLNLLEYIVNSDKRSMISHVIQTNGSYLKKKSDLVMALLPMVSEMRVSFDAATAKTYHQVRAGGQWPQLLDNVRWLRQQIDVHVPNCQLTADFVVQSANYLEIPAFVDLCKDLGITKINWQKMWNWGTWPKQEFDNNNIYNPDHPLYLDLQKQFDKINQPLSLI